MTREEYEKYAISLSGRLLKVATRLAYPDFALAEDLVQSALVKGYLAVLEGKFEAEKGGLAWLTNAITFDYLTIIRKRKRSDLVDPDSVIFTNLADESNPEKELSKDLLSSEMAEALSQLTEDQRQCIELIDLAEMSYEEAADFLNLPIGTVRSRLSRGRYAVANFLTRNSPSFGESK